VKVACLDLPALPLQLVWRKEPELRREAVVVIDEDRPQGTVLWACERARLAGVLPGQRYAHALSLDRGCRAGVVPPALFGAAIALLRAGLHFLSPQVGPGEPGTFWLDGDGLVRIFIDGDGPHGHVWAMTIQRTIRTLGFAGAVVVGFSRFATYAIARATRTGVTVLRGDADERVAASAVPLARLDVDPKLRDSLARLGVTTVGQMVRLPGGGILERFGREAHRLYQLAAGERWDPLVPMAPPEAPDEHVLLDDDETDVERPVFLLKGAIHPLLDRLAARGRGPTAFPAGPPPRPERRPQGRTLGLLQARMAHARRAHARQARSSAARWHAAERTGTRGAGMGRRHRGDARATRDVREQAAS